MATVSQGFRDRMPQLSKRTLIIAGVVIIAIIAAIIAPSLAGGTTATQAGTTATAITTDVQATISATGKITPVESALLSFRTVGEVTEILVAEGDQVAAQAALVRLDSRMLDLDVQAANAVVSQAEADIASAEAQLSAAEASLKQILGSVSASDIAAARASLAEAQARLNLLSNGTRAEVLARTEAAVAQAQADYDLQKKNLAVAKEDADLVVAQRANELRDAQSTLNRAREDLAHVEKDETDPRTGRKLTDAEKKDYAGTYDTALRAVANAEANLTQATRDAEVARQNEISGIASAEARLQTAQADLDALKSGANADVAGAQAAVANAQANLNKLLGDQRDAQVEIQEANVAAAQAGVAGAKARLIQAQAQAAMAALTRDEATLTAPFAGVVASVSTKVGELVGNTPVVEILNTSVYEVIITVDEIDVASVAVGQTVNVLVDAIGTPALTGKVVRISPQAQSDRGVVSYSVTVEVTPDDRPIKSGMTASAEIITAQATNVVALPRTAVQTVDGVSTVTVSKAGTSEERTVELGVKGSEYVEIRSGVAADEVVIIPSGGE